MPLRFAAVMRLFRSVSGLLDFPVAHPVSPSWPRAIAGAIMPASLQWLLRPSCAVPSVLQIESLHAFLALGRLYDHLKKHPAH
jgi:hypothetical protein